jgi:hypothetical protein
LIAENLLFDDTFFLLGMYKSESSLRFTLVFGHDRNYFFPTGLPRLCHEVPVPSYSVTIPSVLLDHLSVWLIFFDATTVVKP